MATSLWHSAAKRYHFPFTNRGKQSSANVYDSIQAQRSRRRRRRRQRHKKLLYLANVLHDIAYMFVDWLSNRNRYLTRWALHFAVCARRICNWFRSFGHEYRERTFAKCANIAAETHARAHAHNQFSKCRALSKYKKQNQSPIQCIKRRKKIQQAEQFHRKLQSIALPRHAPYLWMFCMVIMLVLQ